MLPATSSDFMSIVDWLASAVGTKIKRTVPFQEGRWAKQSFSFRLRLGRDHAYPSHLSFTYLVPSGLGSAILQQEEVGHRGPEVGSILYILYIYTHTYMLYIVCVCMHVCVLHAYM